MAESVILDVTRIAPRLKHSTLFQHFDALHDGEALVIHNDHDPKPLYYQLLGERGDIFSWEYLQQGPSLWQVKINKKNLQTGEDTIGMIAAKDLRKAEVFRKYGLDFCCGGKKSLALACTDAGVKASEVEKELNQVSQEVPGPKLDFNAWNLDFLADYIVNVHHRYVAEATPVLIELSQKVTERHGTSHPELETIKKHVTALMSEMQSHQIKEEKILFPFIREMVQCQREGRPFTHPPFGTIASPVQMMEEDHQVAGEHIHALEELSQNYTVPADGCDSYRLYYRKLDEFDADLQLHLHLENNILFPKSIALEKKLVN